MPYERPGGFADGASKASLAMPLERPGFAGGASKASLAMPLERPGFAGGASKASLAMPLERPGGFAGGPSKASLAMPYERPGGLQAGRLSGALVGREIAVDQRLRERPLRLDDRDPVPLELSGVHLSGMEVLTLPGQLVQPGKERLNALGAGRKPHNEGSYRQGDGMVEGR
jgi:hypothetical protein